ncbi:MAG: hypothetical protein V3W34_07540 [Phycisphaerae bacterium]
MVTPDALRILCIEVEADIVAVNRLLEELNDARRRVADEPSQQELSHIAYMLHSIYTAWEGAFHRIATTFENRLDPARWHEQLLRRMSLAIPHIRPAVIRKELLEDLATLRSFRHFFRHSYAVPLRWHKMQIPLDSVDQAAATVNASLRRFLDVVEEIAEKAGEDPS